MSEFYRYFRENMDALGLAAPETLFANATTALATATALATQRKMLYQHWQQTA
ncbi:hypothetical protein [Pseudomonas petrae]|uniref:Uncharacterized protein n=1 Tax=Pseudomonas petrae TaxID=2912190 RepID=A0ABS9I6N6_9PSED|nr:hypothetical protein [Pseudomonas petrae]MCF7535509.1 hypothetical protein [Pseudomonas petrae]MCF7543101.1 hypothetical protein [Pseudomonas petrae]MCF7558850.1 hypothetical protein [Pseudomonas petrae]